MYVFCILDFQNIAKTYILQCKIGFFDSQEAAKKRYVVLEVFGERPKKYVGAMLPQNLAPGATATSCRSRHSKCASSRPRGRGAARYAGEDWDPRRGTLWRAMTLPRAGQGAAPPGLLAAAADDAADESALPGKTSGALRSLSPYSQRCWRRSSLNPTANLLREHFELVGSQ